MGPSTFVAAKVCVYVFMFSEAVPVDMALGCDFVRPIGPAKD